jgi:hypothetical protein
MVGSSDPHKESLNQEAVCQIDKETQSNSHQAATLIKLKFSP